MSSSTFTPSAVVDMSKEREWPSHLGMLDWDKTHIVFTKRTLLEFLKYTGTTVDPNYTNIQKLPRYARFGTIHDEAPNATASAGSGAVSPSRSVGTAAHIFGNTEVDDDALAGAPPPPQNSAAVTAAPLVNGTVGASQDVRAKSKRTPSSGVAGLWDPPTENEFKPSRRVRERPGGKDSIAELF